MAGIDLLAQVDRRRFLSLAGAAAAGGVAAACAGDDSTGAATPTPGASSDHGAAPSPSGGAGRPKAQGKLASIYDAVLPPLDPNPRKTLVIDATDVAWEVAAGVKLNAWTFDSFLPGKVVHLRQGDTVDFTFRNKSTLGHSIDFHAARTPWDKNYITIVPDQEISYTWTADYPGAFMYHCGTGPVLQHIANGMYGAVVVDPAEGFAPAREYVLVQSEFYLKEADDGGGNWDGDIDRMLAVQPDFVTFNGSALQYQQQPLPAAPGELIRLYVVNAGPTLFSAFHVIGALFDRVYTDGNPANVMRGLQTWTVPPGGGATFELVIPEPGQYPFVTHSFAYTGLGAVGLIEVA